jgi:hypothetical protein
MGGVGEYTRLCVSLISPEDLSAVGAGHVLSFGSHRSQPGYVFFHPQLLSVKGTA